MNHKIMLTLVFLFGNGWAFAQESYIRASLVNRTVHEQDGHFLITTLEAPVYVYAVQGASIATSEYFPFYLLQEDTTSTAFPESICGISVFPNPVRDVLSIQRETTDEAFDIEFYTMEGRQVMQRAWPPGVKTLQYSLSSLMQGTYVLMITDQRRVKGNQYKIIRQ